jgi:hypothetical protein
MAGIGAADGVFGGLDKPSIAPPIAPILPIDPPVLQRIGRQRLQALPLASLVEMHPEFKDQRAIIGQQPLEDRIVVEATVEIGLIGAAIDAIEQRARIPARQKQADLSMLWQIPPKAPQGRPFTLLLRRLVISVGDDPMRIEPFIEQIDGFRFAGAIDPGEQDQHRKLGLAQSLLQSEQVQTQGSCGLVELFARDFRA